MKQKQWEGKGASTEAPKLSDDETLRNASSRASKAIETIRESTKVWVGCYPNCCKHGYWKYK